ncbi:prohibitin family protein [Lutimonas halocynthiae]|uniref:prohibitin family protein n=1 Tax=Lutimonas halocynthiae TaxID=1446477 RepID=UPI0025B42D97|nr:prohibitin family protein [Lutimonas halocynthiae]MDN3644119.1 prohibitin family protein [Lutimonas halocynthiae]
MAQQPQLQFPKGILPIVFIGIILLIFISKSTVTLDAGEAGVLWKRFAGGVVTDQPPLGEGFHLVAPWNTVIVYETRQQELTEKMKVLSSNGLDIQLEATAWYQPVTAELGFLHQTKGTNYLDRVLKPAMRSATRSVVGRYTPEQIYSSKRDAIQEEIFDETKKIVQDQHIQLNDVLVRDVTLPVAIKDAIERKLSQEQTSLEYKFKLEIAQKEADKQRIEAQGKADANRILSASLTDKILQDKGIEATLKLSQSANTKVVVVGGSDGLPLILGNN